MSEAGRPAVLAWKAQRGVLCSMLAAVENTHGPEQMAVEEGDGANRRELPGISYMGVQSGRDGERS